MVEIVELTEGIESIKFIETGYLIGIIAWYMRNEFPSNYRYKINNDLYPITYNLTEETSDWHYLSKIKWIKIEKNITSFKIVDEGKNIQSKKSYRFLVGIVKPGEIYFPTYKLSFNKCLKILTKNCGDTVKKCKNWVKTDNVGKECMKIMNDLLHIKIYTKNTTSDKDFLKTIDGFTKSNVELISYVSFIIIYCINLVLLIVVYRLISKVESILDIAVNR